MRPISWLHLSDFHLRVRDAWPQDVVLTALCDSIARQREAGLIADFILATGDLAFSGKGEEYALAADFFDALCKASNVPKDRVFVVPGNHDVDRDRQRYCFSGALQHLSSSSHVDSLLGGAEDPRISASRQAHARATALTAPCSARDHRRPPNRR